MGTVRTVTMRERGKLLDLGSLKQVSLICVARCWCVCVLLWVSVFACTVVPSVSAADKTFPQVHTFSRIRSACLHHFAAKARLEKLDVARDAGFFPARKSDVAAHVSQPWRLLLSSTSSRSRTSRSSSRKRGCQRPAKRPSSSRFARIPSATLPVSCRCISALP